MLVFICAVGLSAAAAARDQVTTVVVSALTSSATPAPGTDGQQHVVYELVLTNTSATPATLQTISVVDAASPSKALATFRGADFMSRLRTTGSRPVKDANLDLDSTRLFLIDIAIPAGSAVPSRLLHTIDLMGGSMPGPTATTPVALSYTVAPIAITRELRVIGPPLKGQRWVAANGCCAPGGVHRGTGLPVNGEIYFAQRFAIDWMQLDDQGRFVKGDAADVHNYTCYGADVLAVADGTVIQTLNNLEDQKPGTLPDPKTINIDNIDGNHVILDLGGGVYAFYAHMQKDSVAVHVGDRVTRGQVLGKLGNTGNTSAPHLHFQ
ncbi:MAG TPA: M23 family metallopeptidase, partial [Gemmatimonadaceae bacterium]|nr:M23 family metallopeptidase [Gemmatimonadaceae bacterium]